MLLPDGAGAPAGTQVAISFGDLTVTTDGSGRFDSTLPIPAGSYAITALAPSGLRGQTRALIPAGGSVDVVVQLLGLGSTTGGRPAPDGQPVPGAAIVLERGSFPGERFNGTTDAAGQIRFVNVTEGPFSVTAEEADHWPERPGERNHRARRGHRDAGRHHRLGPSDGTLPDR